jgi:hypothetical protein
MMKLLLLAMSALWTFSVSAKIPAPLLQELYWLEGTWACENQPGVYEEWKRLPDGSLQGMGYFLKNKEKNISERMKIEKIGDRLFYIVQLTGSRREVRFALEIRQNRFVFSNRKHDFPQIIMYERLKTRRFKAVISDFSPTGGREEVYYFNKIGSRSWEFN